MQALQSEATEPRNALRLYRKIAKHNSKFDKTIFLTSIGTLVLATVVAFYVAQKLDHYESIAIIFIIFVFGYNPPLILWQHRVQQRDKIETKWYWRTPFSIFVGFTYVFSKLLILIVITYYLALILLPVVIINKILNFLLGVPFLWDLPFPSWFDWLGALLIILVTIVYLIDIDWNDLFPPIIGGRVIFAGLILNMSNILGFFAGMAIGGSVIVSVLFTEFIYEDLYTTMLVASIAGIFLGIDLSKRFESHPKLKLFTILGRIRCHIRLGQWGLAGYRLRQTLNEESGKGGVVYGDLDSPFFHLVHCLSSIYTAFKTVQIDLLNIETFSVDEGVIHINTGLIEVEASGAEQDLIKANVFATRFLAERQGFFGEIVRWRIWLYPLWGYGHITKGFFGSLLISILGAIGGYNLGNMIGLILGLVPGIAFFLMILAGFIIESRKIGIMWWGSTADYNQKFPEREGIKTIFKVIAYAVRHLIKNIRK